MCGWRASLNGRAQRGREQRVGRRFWARRFSPVERVFTGERVGPEGAEREMAPSSLAVDARTGWTERFSVTSRLQKSATSGEILSTVTRVSRCVKNSAAGNDILTELFFVSSRHHPVRASAHPRQYQFSRPRFSFFLCLSLFTYLFIRYIVCLRRREKLAVEFRRPILQDGSIFSGGVEWSNRYRDESFNETVFALERGGFTAKDRTAGRRVRLSRAVNSRECRWPRWPPSGTRGSRRGTLIE